MLCYKKSENHLKTNIIHPLLRKVGIYIYNESVF